MTTETEIKLHARLSAIEYLIQKLLASALQGLSDEQFDSLISDFHSAHDGMTIAGVDAAMSDHVASEIRDEVDRLMKGVKTLRRLRK